MACSVRPTFFPSSLLVARLFWSNQYKSFLSFRLNFSILLFLFIMCFLFINIPVFEKYLIKYFIYWYNFAGYVLNNVYEKRVTMKHQIDKYRKSNIEKNFSFENEVGDLDTEYRDDLEMTQTKKTKLQEVLLMRHGDVSEDRDIGCFTDHGKYRMEKAIPPYRAILQGKRVEIISSPSPKTRESSEMLIDGLHLSSRRKEYNEWTRTLVYVDIISTSDVLYSDHGLSIRD